MKTTPRSPPVRPIIGAIWWVKTGACAGLRRLEERVNGKMQMLWRSLSFIYLFIFMRQLQVFMGLRFAAAHVIKAGYEELEVLTTAWVITLPGRLFH